MILLGFFDNFLKWLSEGWDILCRLFFWICEGFAYFFALLAVLMVLAFIRLMFQRDEMGRELREGCLAYVAIFSVPIVFGLIFGLCTRDKKREPVHQTFMSATSEQDSHPWSGNHLEKENINDVGWDDTVFICTSGSSKRFHSTLACPGMQNCNSGADAITRADAEDMGRTHCRRCYY